MKFVKVAWLVSFFALLGGCERTQPLNSDTNLIPTTVRAGDKYCQQLISPFVLRMSHTSSASKLENSVELDAEDDFYWNSGALIGRDHLFQYLDIVSKLPERPRLTIKVDRRASCRNTVKLLLESRVPLICERSACLFQWQVIPRDPMRYMPYGG